MDRIDANSIRVMAPSPIILLCGGPIEVETPNPSSLREAFTRIYERPGLNAYATVTPEEFEIFAPHGQYTDWLSFESEFAQIVDLIVLFSESYGSVAELGAFSMVEEIALRLLVVIDDRSYNDKSFIKLGPILYLESKYGKSSICVVNRNDVKIERITNVEGVDLDRLAENLISAIEARRQDYKEHTTFDASRPGHLIKLIVGLIQHYGALTAVEIEVLLYALELKVPTTKIPDYLLCAANAGWIVKDKRGLQEYYCAKPNIKQAVTYKIRKDIAAEDKDRDRWRTRVIAYWKDKEPVRFSSIQSALKGAL
ncbi:MULTISPECIES: retron St85 family effector protein [unclassified Mesorhizobium]|uniref:retron St85 family effector protein n=1 Tax=unclassified Mesorhizobium TaxID=325217 RepID=UPI000FDB03C9|nr:MULTISPECIES: retron St85 family effector protein [unclassified Mesorhizobium]TGR47386.1 hypothetical protein EN842_23870 [bacterium M00.F.Ca.ET.199.01.1.1]TGU36839.1 hypothetical protein EN799_14655 [bacterium M00.F.Ca.ET.156.01.1.1]TGV88027.1 hypothetical protein EN792_010900 [Mesorhizobium sp. M00.F.Ca.ET.149.01.1.1]TGR29099.1 hypothetical protein EN845_12150 [Mesorhizobium sp. M8A.F.Ca.ET.202.01.1.1]TGR29676.1 hypothetical protein EN840_08205 [Mesorhizobium sp. M8A.F.Ca.ET.197.01.1.1]